MKAFKTLVLALTAASSLHGQTWVQVGEGLHWNVHDLISYNGYLHAGGRLGSSANGVYYWDGTNWISSGSPSGIWAPIEMADYEGVLCVGGDHANSGAGSQTHVKGLFGNGWGNIGGEFQTASGGHVVYVKSLYSDGDYLYAGGGFGKVGGVPAKNIARWNGSEWQGMGDGLPGWVVKMATFQDKLLINYYDQIALPWTVPVDVVYLQIWNGNDYESLLSVFGLNSISLLDVIDNKVYFATQSPHINGVPIQKIGAWDGENIYNIGDAEFKSVSGVHQHNGRLFALGSIHAAQPWNSTHVIRELTPEGWVNVGGVFNQGIHNAITHEGVMYVAGFFDEYDGQPMNYIARLDESVDVPEQEMATNTSSVVSCFPNPASEITTLALPDNTFLRADVLDMTGREMLSVDLTGKTLTTLNLSGLKPGTFSVRVIARDKAHMHVKLVVER